MEETNHQPVKTKKDSCCRPADDDNAKLEKTLSGAQPNQDILANSKDSYNTRYILSKEISDCPAEFERKLKSTLEEFRQNKVKGVFLELDIEKYALIGVAKNHGFSFHHTENNTLAMQCWLPNPPNRLPHYASHYVGVGGLVVDWEQRKVLVIKEKQGNDVFTWKIPGGLVDVGEYIGEAVEREVREETGIEATFKGVISLREKKYYNFGRNDIYIICLLEPKTTAIKMCEIELAHCKWMDVDEWCAQEFKVETQKIISSMAQHMMNTFRDNKDKSQHLQNLLYSRDVEIAIPSFTGTHLMYVPSNFVVKQEE